MDSCRGNYDCNSYLQDNAEFLNKMYADIASEYSDSQALCLNEYTIEPYKIDRSGEPINRKAPLIRNILKNKKTS